MLVGAGSLHLQIIRNTPKNRFSFQIELELRRKGNWNYGQLNAQRVRTTTNQASCLACHKPRAAEDFMFTRAKLVEYVRN